MPSPPSKTLLVCYLEPQFPNTWGGKPIECLRDVANVFPLHYDQWRKNALPEFVRFKAHQVQRWGMQGLEN